MRSFWKRSAVFAAVFSLALLGAEASSAAVAPASSSDDPAASCEGPCPIQIVKRGDGTGLVYSTEPAPGNRWYCGPVCDNILEDWEQLRLIPQADTGSYFRGWEGPCTNPYGDNTCVIPAQSGPGGVICAKFSRSATAPVACASDAPATPPPPPFDTTPPNTRILAAPARSTRSRTATFRFRASEPSTLICKLDRRAWLPCRSPKTYRNLKPGLHAFRVKGIDSYGNVETTPASRSWRIRR